MSATGDLVTPALSDLDPTAILIASSGSLVVPLGFVESFGDGYTAGYAAGVLAGVLTGPVLSNITPAAALVTPGTPGAFSATFRVARLTPIEFDITGIYAGGRIAIAVHYDDRNETYQALSVDGAWLWPFDLAADNTIGPITPEPVHVRMLPRGGWPPCPVRFTVATVKASA